jgi:hypothetical protein
VRVGLGSFVLGPDCLGRWTDLAVSDRDLLERRLAIPVREPIGLDRIGVVRLGPGSEITAVGPWNALRDGVGTGTGATREDGFGRRGADVGRRRYRARLIEFAFSFFY